MPRSVHPSSAPASSARSTAQQERDPEAVHSGSGTAHATPEHGEDILRVPNPGGSRNGPFDPIDTCPLCGAPLRADGACIDCKVQFVGISAEVAARVNFRVEAGPAKIGPDGLPVYRQFWDMDDQGCAIMCFQSQTTGWRVWLSCFMNYLDSFGKSQTRFPYWIREPRLGGLTVQILSDLTDEQFKERAAHIPGRVTSEHQRRYDSDQFQRSYYWVWMDRASKWQTRAERKAVIVGRHRRAGCKPGCTKRHRVRD